MHWDNLRRFNGLCVTNMPEKEALSAKLPKWVKLMKRQPKGMCLEKDGLSWNKSSGATAVNLAYHLGAKKVVLLGFDMKAGPNGERNYHPNLKNPDSPSKGLLHLHTSGFQEMQDAIVSQKLDFKVVNANPHSTLTMFPKVSFKETL